MSTTKKSIGQLMRTARKSQGLELAQVSEEINISHQYLEAIEEDRVVDLPPDPFRVGFIKSYGEYLGLDVQKVVALYRRDYGSPVRSRSQTVFKRIRNSYPIFFSGSSIVFTASLLLLFGYVSWQWQQALRPPRLLVSYPGSGQELTSPFTVTGEATSDVIIRINTEPASVTQGGSFSKEMVLPSGEHTLIIEATNRRGKTRFVERVVNVVE